MLLAAVASAQVPPLPPAVPVKQPVTLAQSPHAASNPQAVAMAIPTTNAPKMLTLYVTTPFCVQTSSNLVDWTILVTNVTAQISIAATNPCAFFRVSQWAKLSWTPDPAADGSKIYAGSTSGNYDRSWDVGNVTCCRVRVRGGANYFMATDYDKDSESDPSNEVTLNSLPVYNAIQ